MITTNVIQLQKLQLPQLSTATQKTSGNLIWENVCTCWHFHSSCGKKCAFSKQKTKNL